MKPRIAIVTHALDGGVRTVVDFLYNVLEHDGRYQIDLIFLATSMHDSASIRLLSPRTWCHYPQLIPSKWNGKPMIHAGAHVAELEFQRYQPRRILTKLFQEYDLIQIVGGSPAWANVARHANRPVCVFAATTARQERVSVIRQTKGLKKYWLMAMTNLVTRIEQRALRSADCVFAESEYTQQTFSQLISHNNICVAPPGVDTDFFRPAQTPTGKKHIISVGRFADPRKNVRLLFQSYHQLLNHSTQVPDLVLAGRTSPTPADMAFASSLGIRQRIQVNTDVSPEALRELYQNACMFVLSSDEEGLGIVILEAMASGLPVVSTDCGGPATAVQPGITGYLTPVGNADVLAEAMRKLLNDPALGRQMGDHARLIAETCFSIHVAGQVYLDQYVKLLGATRSNG
jgi:glycosyltransferase involved in cell wall biosynthesis